MVTYGGFLKWGYLQSSSIYCIPFPFTFPCFKESRSGKQNLPRPVAKAKMLKYANHHLENAKHHLENAQHHLRKKHHFSDLENDTTDFWCSFAFEDLAFINNCAALASLGCRRAWKTW